jgi:hypothetical protein
VQSTHERTGKRHAEPREWSRADIVDAILRHVELYGEPPRYEQWRKAADGHPRAATVERKFGSWDAAIASAGWRPRRGTGDRPIVCLRRAAERYRAAERVRDDALRVTAACGASQGLLCLHTGLAPGPVAEILERQG